MNTLQSILLFILGIALVLYFAEKLVKGTVGISLGFGISTFIISVIFIGFDPENLAVGAVGSYERASGIALGSIIGAAMVAIALAFGLTALIAPMKFEKAPKQILIIPVLAVLLLGLLGLDGQLSRIDGAVLLLGFVLSIIYLIRLSKKGLDIQPTGEVAETLEDAGKLNKWKSLGIFILSLAGVVLGSELLVRSSQSIIAKMGLSDTVFGMTILAVLISIEELARELPAAIKGRPEISYGNVIGSILAFFLFNAGIIALVKPITVDVETLKYYLPICLVTTLIVSIFMSTKKVSRLAGAVLVLLYVAFAAVGFII
ncbi:MAG: sodium:calcium antiporter [Bacteroidales bacterium]|nr:sodium:calcium antiporter [Bacteroidales bacterium]